MRKHTPTLRKPKFRLICGFLFYFTIISESDLDAGTKISVTIIDTTTNQVIAVSRATVKHA